MALRCVLASVAAFLLLAPSAHGGSLRAVAGSTSCERSVCSATLAVTYEAGTGERLDATFTEAEDGALTVVDREGLAVVEGCTAVDATTARCGLSDPRINSPFVKITARGGDGDDRLAADRRIFSPELDGGPGDDVLVGRGDLFGGPGDDTLNGLGEDITTLDGGPGADRLANGTVSYVGRRAGVRFDASRVGSKAGEANEGDVVGPGVLGLVGGDGPNMLTARAAGTRIEGGRGDDTLVGGAGRDELLGGGGSDRLDGRGGGDQLAGGGSKTDRDVLRGGPGRDEFALTASREDVEGGPGSDIVERPGAGDVVALRGAARDVVRCRDRRSERAPTLLLDRFDLSYGGCRGIRRSGAAVPEVRAGGYEGDTSGDAFALLTCADDHRGGCLFVATALVDGRPAGRATYRLPAGAERGPLPVRLDARARRRTACRGRLTVVLRVRPRDAAGRRVEVRSRTVVTRVKRKSAC